jgi:hypothetical protein
MKKYKVTLTAEERNSLQALIAAQRTAAKKAIHARILLKADAGPPWPSLDRRPHCGSLGDAGRGRQDGR